MNDKVIQFRRPQTKLSHPVDCLFCRKSWLMDIDTTMSAVCCPYCGEHMDIEWE
jgi:transcription elongation factor Elf1